LPFACLRVVEVKAVIIFVEDGGNTRIIIVLDNFVVLMLRVHSSSLLLIRDQGSLEAILGDILSEFLDHLPDFAGIVREVSIAFVLSIVRAVVVVVFASSSVTGGVAHLVIVV
jgi:hypothetical protein